MTLFLSPVYRAAVMNRGQAIDVKLWLHYFNTHKPVHDIFSRLERPFVLKTWASAHSQSKQGAMVHPPHIATLKLSSDCCCKHLLWSSSGSGYKDLRHQKLHLHSSTPGNRWYSRSCTIVYMLPREPQTHKCTYSIHAPSKRNVQLLKGYITPNYCWLLT